MDTKFGSKVPYLAHVLLIPLSYLAHTLPYACSWDALCALSIQGHDLGMTGRPFHIPHSTLFIS